MSQLTHKEEEKNWIKVIYLKWEVDESNIDELKDALLPFLDSDKKDLVINISELMFINSMVIWWLANLVWDFTEKWKKFVFAEPNEEIFDIIDLVWLTEVVETYDTNEEAILSFSE